MTGTTGQRGSQAMDMASRVVAGVIATGETAAVEAAKAELAVRIAALDVRAAYVCPQDLAGDVDAIRCIAHDHALNPAVTVSHFLSAALARGSWGMPVHGWLALLGDAVHSERQDVAACDDFAATCSMRLAS